MGKYNSIIKKCIHCGASFSVPKCHYDRKFCSKECHYNNIGRKIKVNCFYCNKEVKIKKTNKCKRHFCSKSCYEKQRKEDLRFITDRKEEIIKKHQSGIMLKNIADELGVDYSRFCYHTRNFGIKATPFYKYNDLMKKIGADKTQKYLDNFQQMYDDKKISWRTAHKMANKKWGITQSPCKICGWKEAERDMHLLIPHLLKKENAISVCPNCHRLFHRGKIEYKGGDM